MPYCTTANFSGLTFSPRLLPPKTITSTPQNTATRILGFAPFLLFRYQSPRSINLDCSRVARRRGHLPVPCNQGSPQLFRERHIGRVVRAQVLPEPPDAMKQERRCVARDAQ